MSIEDPYIKVFETAKLHLKCRTVSLIPVTTQWMRNNKVLNETRSSRSNTLDLIIENVTQTNTSKYKCFAKNRIGSSSASVDVVGEYI